MLTKGISYIVIRDITELKQSRNMLTEQNELLKNFFENSIMGFAAFNKEKKILFNEAIFQITGYHPDDFENIEDYFFEIYPDKNHRSKLFQERKKIQNRKKAYNELQITCKNGEKKTLALL